MTMTAHEQPNSIDTINRLPLQTDKRIMSQDAFASRIQHRPEGRQDAAGAAATAFGPSTVATAADAELDAAVASLDWQQQAAFHAAVDSRLAAGEPTRGLRWRSLVDARFGPPRCYQFRRSVSPDQASRPSGKASPSRTRSRRYA